MAKFKIYAGLKRPYASLHLVEEREFLTNREAKWYAQKCARKIYREHESYDSALVTREEIREHPVDFGISSLKEEDSFESENESEYFRIMNSWLLFNIDVSKL